MLGIPWAWWRRRRRRTRTGTGLFLELGFTVSQVQSSRGGDYLGRKWGSGLQLASALYHQGGRWSQDKHCPMLQPNVIIWLRVISWTWTTDINNHTDDERKWLLICNLRSTKAGPEHHYWSVYWPGKKGHWPLNMSNTKQKTKWRNLSTCVVGLSNTNTIQMYALNIKHTM